MLATGELNRRATVAGSATVQREGDREVTRQIEYFNLDAILSVGNRVNSKRGTQFRIWATARLREHLLRGYTLDERRPVPPAGTVSLESARRAIASLRDTVASRGARPGLFGQERGDQPTSPVTAARA